MNDDQANSEGRLNPTDAWREADAYEYYIGRWSRMVASGFLAWLGAPTGKSWLDVGCGSGALTEALLAKCDPAQVTAVDRSAGFISGLQRRLGSRVHFTIGDACKLPLQDESVEFTVSGLVLNFIAEPIAAVLEMRRVTSRNGTIGVYVWDYSGTMDILNYFWDALVTVVPAASPMREGYRFPNTTEKAMRDMFVAAGLADVSAAPIEIETHFSNFADYWQPFLGGQGPAPTYLMSLDSSDRDRVRKVLDIRLPRESDGSIRLRARAWAVKGVRV